MNYYIKKPIPVKAKLFAPGDEDGFIDLPLGSEWSGEERKIPYVQTLEGRELQGSYGEHYIVYGNHDDRWLVAKKIFEETYELVQQPYST